MLVSDTVTTLLHSTVYSDKRTHIIFSTADTILAIRIKSSENKTEKILTRGCTTKNFYVNKDLASRNLMKTSSKMLSQQSKNISLNHSETAKLWTKILNMSEMEVFTEQGK